jgi:hypothetical protein
MQKIEETISTMVTHMETLQNQLLSMANSLLALQNQVGKNSESILSLLTVVSNLTEKTHLAFEHIYSVLNGVEGVSIEEKNLN